MAVVVLLVGLALVTSKPQEARKGTSFDAAGPGFRAAYLLLEELKFPVTRSRHVAEGQVRWLLAPKASERDLPSLDAWVRGGGLALLADPEGDAARGLGLNVDVQTVDDDEQTLTQPAPMTIAGGPLFVELRGASGQVWATAGGRPVVTVVPHGRGEVWLVHRPDFLDNKNIGRADNGLFLVRLAQECLKRRPGAELAFDEFFHGLRDRPGVVELLLQPPALWVTLQGLVLIVLLLWRHGPRFGPRRQAEKATRRSSEEFLDAYASLLERKGDRADAFRALRDAFRRDLEREHGLPHDAPVGLLAADAARGRDVNAEELLRLLNAPGPKHGGDAGLLQALHQLEKVRHEFLPGRAPR